MSMEMLWNVPSGLHLHLQPLNVPSGLHFHLRSSNVLSVTHLWLWMYAHSVNVVSCMDVWRICKLITCWKNENSTICKYIYHHTDHITNTLTKLPIVNTLVLVYISLQQKLDLASNLAPNFSVIFSQLWWTIWH